MAGLEVESLKRRLGRETGHNFDWLGREIGRNFPGHNLGLAAGSTGQLLDLAGSVDVSARTGPERVRIGADVDDGTRR